MSKGDAEGEEDGVVLSIEVDGNGRAIGSLPLVIGRDPGCDIVIDDPRVSREHLRVEESSNGWTVVDTSTNGTYLGAERIATLEVTSTVVLRLGDVNDGPSISLGPSQPSDSGEPPLDLGVLSTVHMTDLGTVTIGRDPSNDVVLSDLGVSRFHAELRPSSDGPLLVDLGSFNGTFVNGQPVKQQLIAEPDVVSIGSHVLRLLGRRLIEYIDRERVSLEAVDLSVPAPNGMNIINEVSFVLPSNSVTAIVGPSGSGKTTLLKGLAGDRATSGGTVLYRGRDLFENLPAFRPRFGFVPQDDVLHLDLTVQQSLTFAADLRFPPDTSKSERKERIWEVVSELGLSDRLDLPVGQLSGGQRKRVSVAFELLTQPTVVFLDEPTSGLDPGYERSLMLMLRRLADGGRTLLLVTHATESLALCNRVLFLARGGRIAYFGQPHEALEFFEGDDYADVFRRLDQNTTDWASRYQTHAQISRSGPVIETPPDQPQPEPRQRRGRRSALRQLPTLLRREFVLLSSDWRRLLMLLLQGPIIGALFLYALNRGEFGLPTDLDPRFSRMVVVALVLGITWIALAATLREIVGHRRVYERERSVGLSPFAYVTAKFLVFGPLISLEAAAFTALAIHFQSGPATGAVLSSGRLEVMVGVALVGLAAVSLGLMVSAATSSPNQAMAIFPLLLVLQLLFSGLFPSMTADPVGERISYGTSAQWGFTAIASTVDLNALEQYTNLILEFQRRGTKTAVGAVGEALFDKWREEGTEAFEGNLSAEEQAALPLVAAFAGVVSAAASGETLPELSEELVGQLGNPEWDHEPDVWYRSVVALGVLTILGYLGTWLIVRWRDRLRGR